ncbi:LON peptidase N-terminal domain and RING finger protein 2 isoform X1 [Monodelphis domestica]|uniref:LON peptidase N-terminal domain and ring finger 2 n=2 Tax=Monodelphis domestica TaxID=13616 RepID=F7AP56_MONDO|nr:LON peptidase N-terminal domain and RING finger protein 2 isoform X1 [Monodelphis domestica]
MGTKPGQTERVSPPPGPDAGAPCPELLSVAEEAFRGGNYELAAEIYGSQLAELPQPERSLCLRRGDALARAGRAAEALDSYTVAARLGNLRPEELKELVESCALAIREELRLPPWEPAPCGGESSAWDEPAATPDPVSAATSSSSTLADAWDLFCCPRCRLLLCDPVTLHCGHTLCKRCTETDPGLPAGPCCPAAKSPPSREDSCPARVNVVLGNLLEKCFQTESRVRRLVSQAESLQHRHELDAALHKYDQALELAPGDSLLTVQRAELCTVMKKYNQALHDADAICRRKPLWPKGHYVKAQALLGLGKTEEALKEFLYCVALNPGRGIMKKEAQKIMCEVFFPALENVHENLSSPIRSRTPYTRLKPKFLSNINTKSKLEDDSSAGCSKDSLFQFNKILSQESDVYQNSDSSVSHHVLDLHFEDKKTFKTALSNVSSASLKRKFSADLEDVLNLNIPNKISKEDEETLPQIVPSTKLGKSPVILLDASDFECSLCMRLFYEPVTTPCGHTFCLKCLERCLDHTPDCPLCKEKLSEFLASRSYKKTILTEELILRYLPEELSDRKKVYDDEMKELSNLTKDVPIFVCTMAFPTIPCPLHVFEPRYRLMIRRCMETGTKRFGMCLADELKGFADYGCMLEIRDVRFFPDGSSVVDTVGISRFRVLSHGLRDGYNTANIEYLEDKKVEGPDYEELVHLHDSVYDQAVSWFTSLKENMKAQILNHFGSMPSKVSEPQSNPSGPAWYWWLLAVLPLENRAQLAILGMTSLKDRLIAIRRVLIFVTRKRPR